MSKITTAVLGVTLMATALTIGNLLSPDSQATSQATVSHEALSEGGELIASRYYLRKRTSNFFNRAKSRSVRRSYRSIG